MAIPQTQLELLAAIDKNFDKLIGYLHVIPVELTRDKTLEGHAKGTHMSVSDLISYLLGWNNLVIKWLTLDKEGKPIDFPETGFKWNQLGLLAQKFYQDYQHIDYPSLVRELQFAKAHIVELINQHNDDELYGKAWYDKWTMGRMISFNTSSPYANACGRLRKWARVHNVKLK